MIVANGSTDAQEIIEVVILFNRSSGIETSRLSPFELNVALKKAFPDRASLCKVLLTMKQVQIINKKR